MGLKINQSLINDETGKVLEELCKFIIIKRKSIKHNDFFVIVNSGKSFAAGNKL